MRWEPNLPKIDYKAMQKIIDLEKSLCLISGKKMVTKVDGKPVHLRTVEAVLKELGDKAKFGTWYDSEYFKFKVFKKGTGHFQFKDDYIYEQFNIIACKGKNWLPGTK
jgi:hypothetical protein